MADQLPAKSLDIVGLYCPVPLFKTREGIDSIKVGEVLEVIADDPAAEEDITRFVKRTGHGYTCRQATIQSASIPHLCLPKRRRQWNWNL